MENQLYIIYDNHGIFHGFYDDEIVVKNVLKDNSYCCISKNMRDYMLNNLPNIKIKTNLITDTETVIDDLKYFESIPTTIDINKIKNRLISIIKSTCQDYIFHGNAVVLTSEEVKDFSFKIEDQINLKELVDNHHKGEFLYYHANGEYDQLYSYDDIVNIYYTLYNNKLYNQIYTQVLCNWINNTFTLKMYKAKDFIVEYGYTNDEIVTEVNKRYEQQKLS